MTTAPTSDGYWWAMSTFGMGWQLFVVDYVVGTHRLVVRLANAIHSQLPWFTPTPGDWLNWQSVPATKRNGKYAGTRRTWP